MVLSQLLESTWNVQDFSVGMQEDRWVIGSSGVRRGTRRSPSSLGGGGTPISKGQGCLSEILN